METIPDSPELTGAVERSADPLAARNGLRQLFEAHPGLAEEAVAVPVLRDALVAISVASHSLLTGIVSDATALEPLRDPGALAVPRTCADHSVSLAIALTATDDAPAELRRWKRRQMVRIAARDLLGLADLRTVGAELADLAQSCLGAALEIAAPAVPMAVVAMGKLGGRELNYASDVDVLFVHDGSSTDAEHAARALLGVMTSPTADGIVFRTDADLRPEGRSGALSRSIDAFDAYWDRWAQTWELQALIKARPVAGDPSLGALFVERAESRVWPEVMDPDAVRDIRAMKSRTEEMLRLKGVQERELKRGRGGIRDIEFAVQLLQLVHGRHDPSIRSANTLEALEALAVAGYVPVADADRLDTAYEWLRLVEHRLQLQDEQQVHTLPADEGARTQLARVVGFRDSAGSSALEQFDSTHSSHQTVVRLIHEQLFFSPLLETLAGAGPLPLDAAEERLTAFGFRDLVRTRAALAELTAGFTRRSRVMQQLLPVILDWLSASPDPDLGLLQLRRLIEGPTRSAVLARQFRETPVAAERACRVLGSSRVLGLALHRQPDFLEVLADDEALTAERTREDLVDEALDTLDWREDEDGRRAGLRRFKRRHLLRIGARDVLGLAGVETTGRELAHLADAAVEAALRSLEPAVPFAVIGMGRLGGRELSYASDIDVLFVYDGDSPSAFDVAERVATRLMAAIGATTAEGQTFRIDADLRPEGKHGPLARSLDGYRAYYERWALPWEFQSLLRARPIAGDADVSARFMSLAEPHVYRSPLPVEFGARDPSHQGPRGEGADPDLRRPAVPPEARSRVALRRRVHGAASPAAARCRPPRGARRVDDGGARRPAARRVDRGRRRRRTPRGVPPLREGPQLPVPPHRHARRLPPDRLRRGRAPSPHARSHSPPSDLDARRVPEADATLAHRRRARLLRQGVTLRERGKRRLRPLAPEAMDLCHSARTPAGSEGLSAPYGGRSALRDGGRSSYLPTGCIACLIMGHRTWEDQHETSHT
ncbi:MAG: bifunctional [glutamine synthetase] adenylyltransferase/[glutamine synthetase]-adenylyl-L-tyrosine phosphorylase [Acidimicrobiia bacterium]|nr:bifunctional [glutamine synthetase] adenylyltransferase/[glutamine synthetase]-adenylyl-L-tyrosine phosphorylase [Acidimicrobiia bacterium]